MKINKPLAAVLSLAMLLPGCNSSDVATTGTIRLSVACPTLLDVGVQAKLKASLETVVNMHDEIVQRVRERMPLTNIENLLLEQVVFMYFDISAEDLTYSEAGDGWLFVVAMNIETRDAICVAIREEVDLAPEVIDRLKVLGIETSLEPTRIEKVDWGERRYYELSMDVVAFADLLKLEIPSNVRSQTLSLGSIVEEEFVVDGGDSRTIVRDIMPNNIFFFALPGIMPMF